MVKVIRMSVVVSLMLLGLTVAVTARAQSNDDHDLTNQKLLAEESALLKELAGGSNPSVSSSSSSSSSIAAVNNSVPSDPILFDEDQARAALATIGDSKANSKPTESIQLPPAMETAKEKKTTPTFVEQVEDHTPVAQVQKMKGELETRDEKVVSLSVESDSLKKKLMLSEARSARLSKDLEATRNKLMLAETEVERLSRVIEERNRAGIAAAQRSSATPSLTAPVRSMRPSLPAPIQRTETRVIMQQPKAPEDMPVVVVTADKANLRTGPGENNSSLMSVSQGNHLVVETKKGSWFRVFAPNGVRAWVSDDVVTLQRKPGNSFSQLRGVDASVEQETDKLFNDR